MLKPEITQYGERGILLKWESKIDDDIHKTVISYQNNIETQFASYIEETNIGYQSILILLNYSSDLIRLKNEFEDIILQDCLSKSNTNYLYHIPVCYHPKLGLDIESFSKLKNLDISKIVSLHTEKAYKVYFIGFLPGFIYLGGLPERLHLSRQSNPRLSVPHGSVAIGGKQTGIYPQDSPGGWHVLGQTPIELFNVSAEPISLFKPGDFVQFYDISFDEFEKLQGAINSKQFSLRKEAIND